MGKQQSQPTVWRPSQAVVESPIITEGDIFAPLRRVVSQYQHRAARCFGRAAALPKEQSDRAVEIVKAGNYYADAAAAVYRLIPNRYEEAAMEATA